MDKRILNQEELNLLQHFIKSRGFKDEGTVHEILDHFACKVEDLLAENPSLSVSEAMQKAHLSFGFRGFRNIEETYQTQLKSKVKSYYINQLKALTLKPFPFLACTLFFLLLLKFNTNIFKDSMPIYWLKEYYTWLIFGYLSLIELYQILQMPKGWRQHLSLQYAFNPTGFWGTPLSLYFLIMVHPDHDLSISKATVLSIFITTILVFQILHFLARKKTILHFWKEITQLKILE